MKNLQSIKMVLMVSTVLLLLCPKMTEGQIVEDEFHYGFFAGATYSSISNVKTSIIRNVFSSETFNTSESYRFGPTVGFFIYNRFKKSALGIQPEISYAAYGGDFNYSDVDDLNYSIAFKYDYFTVATQLKIHPKGGLFLGLGPQVGFNISKSNIEYKSNKPELGPDLQVEQSLQEVLKGNTEFSILASIGYELSNGFIVEVRYKQGVSDVIETLSNGFYFIENKNTSRAIQATVGYAIPFY